MNEVTDLTKREMVEIDQGIKVVRAQTVNTNQGPISTSKGFTLPFKLMYTNTYNEQKMAPHMKAFQEGSKALMEKCKTKKKGDEDVVDMEKFNKEIEKLLDEKVEDLVLRPIYASQIDEMLNDEYYKKVNKEAGLQEYVSLMFKLIIDDITENGEDTSETKKPEK